MAEICFDNFEFFGTYLNAVAEIVGDPNSEARADNPVRADCFGTFAASTGKMLVVQTSGATDWTAAILWCSLTRYYSSAWHNQSVQQTVLYYAAAL